MTLMRRESRMFKCNCPHEVRAGCFEPKCPHYSREAVERQARLEEQGLRPRTVTVKQCNESD